MSDNPPGGRQARPPKKRRRVSVVGVIGELFITAGHTPASLSMLIPVKDKGTKRTLLYLGGITNKSLTIRSAQQHGQRYMPRLFDYVQQGDLDPSALITHDLPLEDAVRGYEMFKKKQDGCVRVVFRP